MIFEKLWPLFFLSAIPIIILFYFFKPKGRDYHISSNLLWKKSVSSAKPDSFLEKFHNNILMYLQILTVLLITIALMSPFFYKDSATIGRQIILIDTSGSMLQKTSDGHTRFEKEIDEACSFINNTDGLSLSIITHNSSATEILAIDVQDKNKIINLLRSIKPTHCGGNLSDAADLIEELKCADNKPDAGLMLLTDTHGVVSSDLIKNINITKLFVSDESLANISNDYISFEKKENGLYDIIVCCTNHSDQNASLDVSIMDSNDNIISINHEDIEKDKQIFSLFENIKLDSEYIKSSISGISFDNNDSDSLSEDNECYVVNKTNENINALLVSNGNTFLEKAYQAITNEAISKSDELINQDAYNLTIFDSGYSDYASLSTTNNLIFNVSQNSVEEINNIMLNFSDCELVKGIKDFSIGVNKTYVYDVPKWGHSFIEYDSKCVGYYGEHDGKREVIIGFDICESDFPLKAEFPIFISNIVSYLSDSSILTTNIYTAGEDILINGWALNDELNYPSENCFAGLFSIENSQKKEYYAIHFDTYDESEGRIATDYTPIEDTDTAFILNKAKHLISNIFIIIAIIILIIEWIIYIKKYRYKGKFFFVTRALIIVGLLMALFDISLPVLGSKTDTIFIVDMSKSNESNIQTINEYIKSQVKNKPTKNRFGIVCFGQKAMVDCYLSDSNIFANILTTPINTATDFESAIEKALSIIPDGNQKRLVILSDGKQTKGNINNLSRIITSENIELLSLKYPVIQKDDCYISNVIMPNYLHSNEKYSYSVLIESNFDTDGQLIISNSKSESHSIDVHISKGFNKFVLEETVTDSSLENILVTINATGDNIEENNTYNAYATVESNPQLLVIYNPDDNISNFINTLDAMGADYKLATANQAPTDINIMIKYKAIVLANISYDSLPKEFIDNLESYVKDYGLGLICTGGKDSYILGGYKNTVLETVLPVDMTPEEKNIKPSLCMTMIIDRSGSMEMELDGNHSTNKLNAAKNAACEAVNVLESDDYVGVLTFDENYSWAVNITQNTDPDTTKSTIASIPAGGGTTISPALNEAFSKTLQNSAQQKHIVLLSDGQGETSNYETIINKFKNNNITLSTIAVGSDADNILLEHLADSCNGRFYSVTDTDELPNIFIKEVYLGGTDIINEGDYELSVNPSHSVTENVFEDGWPILGGYISTTNKPMANALLTTGELNEPVLSIWQYGLGKTAAWTSDITGEWTSSYSNNDEYVQLWKNIISETTNNQNLGDDDINIVTTNGKIEISYNAKNYKGDTKIHANMVSPNKENTQIELKPVSPGKYESSIPAEVNGLYHFTVTREDGGTQTNSTITGTAIQFADEFKFDITSDAYDSFINHYGKEIDNEYNIWQKRQSSSFRSKSIITYLLLFTLILFLIDVFMRRFDIKPHIPAFVSKPFKQTNKEEVNEIINNATGPNAPANANISTTQSEITEDNNILSKSTPKEVKKKNKRNDNKTNKETQAVLDTSLLLKKKDDRNNQQNNV